VKQFSHDQSRIFDTSGVSKSRPILEDGWVDLYELLQVPPEISMRDLDEVIIDRGADVVYFTFSRAGKPAQVKLLEEHLREMRPILLDPPVRRRYDEQLRLHRSRDPRAISYEQFLQTLDLRDQAAGCMASLIFILASPFTFFLLEKCAATIVRVHGL
jgi:hypothetical protein